MCDNSNNSKSLLGTLPMISSSVSIVALPKSVRVFHVGRFADDKEVPEIRSTKISYDTTSTGINAKKWRLEEDMKPKSRVQSSTKEKRQTKVMMGKEEISNSEYCLLLRKHGDSKFAYVPIDSIKFERERISKFQGDNAENAEKEMKMLSHTDSSLQRKKKYFKKDEESDEDITLTRKIGRASKYSKKKAIVGNISDDLPSSTYTALFGDAFDVGNNGVEKKKVYDGFVNDDQIDDDVELFGDDLGLGDDDQAKVEIGVDFDEDWSDDEIDHIEIPETAKMDDDEIRRMEKLQTDIDSLDKQQMNLTDEEEEEVDEEDYLEEEEEYIESVYESDGSDRNDEEESSSEFEFPEFDESYSESVVKEDPSILMRPPKPKIDKKQKKKRKRKDRKEITEDDILEKPKTKRFRKSSNKVKSSRSKRSNKQIGISTSTLDVVGTQSPAELKQKQLEEQYQMQRMLKLHHQSKRSKTTGSKPSSNNDKKPI